VSSADLIAGRYRLEGGRLLGDDGIRAIEEAVAAMRLLADMGDGVPSFYVDPGDGSYWQRTEWEDGRSELRRVDREYIQANFPSVDPDRPL
jgi:hypothetical protein